MFVEQTPDEHQMAALTKIARRKDCRMINTIRKPDATLTEPGKETIQALAAVHFPAAEEGVTHTQHDNTEKISTAELQDRYETWINPVLVSRALTQFLPNKAAGPDGLKPIIFKYLPNNIVNAITLLYKACIALSHTPAKWRDTKVIFLPKPGKPKYDIPKAYRPISLSNFLLKGLERLVVWKMDKDLESVPIHPSQHGFTKGKSTESAISIVADHIEQFLYQNHHCLGLFLDISSAFDSISIEHIKRELLAHNGDPELVEWYYSYLGKRHLEIELHGDKVTLTTGTGFPQGGVCSARFWLIAFDRAIQIINNGEVTGTGYADDCSVLVGGEHPHLLVEQMQPVLDELVEWGETCGLHFNAQKTVAVMFSRSKQHFPDTVFMGDDAIPYSQSVVYLGVTMDKKLHWQEHIKNKINRTKALLMKMATLTSSYWGPRPQLMRWTYTGVVRPVLSYVAMAWAHESENPFVTRSFRRLNRLAMNTMVKVPRSTPTRAMEIILNVTPLHLHVLQLGLRAYKRLRHQVPLQWVGVYTNLTHSVSHLRFWCYTLDDLELNEEQLNTDECHMPAPDKNYAINASSFTDMENCQQPAECNVYTDGSKMNEQVGAGVYISRSDKSTVEACFRLPDHATVFQAEIMAIREAADILANLDNLTQIKFYVDSQAALRALQNHMVKSKLVLQTIQQLRKVPTRHITFVWTKAHIGNPGNEKADELAKLGTTQDNILDTPTAQCTFDSMLQKKLREVWDTEWLTYPAARQSKLYISPLQHTMPKAILQWPRLKLGRFIRAVTGHNNLLYHLHNMQNDISPLCRFCLEHNEDFHHLQTSCPVLFWERHDIAASDPDHTDKWTPEQIVEFTHIPKINEAFVKPLYNIDEHTDPNHLPSQLISFSHLPTHTQDDESITDISVMDATSLDTSNNDSEYEPSDEN